MVLVPDLKVPLRFYSDSNAFKLYLLDVGLLGAMTDAPAASILIGDHIFSEYKAGGYGVLISGKFGNQNTRKVDVKTEKLVLGLQCLPNKPLNSQVKDLYDAFVCGELDVYDIQTGELSNFILGAIFVFAAGMVYKRKKSRKSALTGSVIGAVAMALVSLVTNYFIVYPAYVVLFHMPLEEIISAYNKILEGVANVPTSNALFNCLLVFNVPFTLAKGLLDTALCFLIYKPLSSVGALLPVT